MYCWDNKITFYWNQSIYDDFYRHSFSIFFEIQDDNKNLIKYETKEYQISETTEHISFPEKMQIMSAQSTLDKIQEIVAAAKLEYANYIME